MLSPSKKKKNKLSRVTEKPYNQNQQKPYKSPVKYDPNVVMTHVKYKPPVKSGIIMDYVKPLLDRFGRQKKGE